MVQKVIGIIADSTYVTDENMLQNGCGGTETWIINIANKLSELNYHVIVFSNISYHHVYYNVEYVSIQNLANRCSHQYFDAILCIRYLDNKTLKIIEEEQCCNNIWFVAHDKYIWKEMAVSSMSYCIDIETNNFLKNSVKGLLVMSQWHKDINKTFWPEDKIHIVGNGINFDNFDIELVNNKNRDNSMFWSSCHERGFDLFVEKIVPYILKILPDFKLYYASYDLGDFPDYSKYPYIKCLGNLNKNDLYVEMCKHKVMLLPMSKWETFCITILEQGYANVEIVCPYRTGVQTSMKIFKELLLDENINFDDENTCKETAILICKKMLNYNSVHQIEIRRIIHNYIEETYSWNNITNKLLQIIL